MIINYRKVKFLWHLTESSIDSSAMPKSFLIKKSDRRKLSTPRKINHGQDKSNISQPSQIDGSDSFMLPYSTSANNEEIFPFSARHVKTFSDSYNSTDDEGVSVSSPLATDADSNFAPSPLAKSPSLAISVYTSLSPLRMTRLNVTDSEGIFIINIIFHVLT